MSSLGFLFIFLIVAAIGFLFGQLAQYRGQNYLNDMIRFLPTDMQAVVKIMLAALATMGAVFVLAAIIDTGPGAFFPFFLASVWLLTTTWVYLDAKARGGRAKAWAMLTFFTFVFGLCGYLITRPDKPRTCPRCMYRLREEFLVCPYCGPQAGLNCSSCQSTLEPSWRYCPYCQTNVASDDSPSSESGPFISLSEESPYSRGPVFPGSVPPS